jgi:hypothetical protein
VTRLTINYGFPTPDPSSVPDVASDMQDLADDIDAEIARVDTDVAATTAVAAAAAVRLATFIRTSNSSTFTTTETQIDTVSATLRAGATYKVTWDGTCTSTISNDMLRMRIRQGTGTGGTGVQLRNTVVGVATSAFSFHLEGEFTAVSDGSQTFSATAQRVIGSGSGSITSNVQQPNYLYIDYVRG